ncbi:hypothetical protein J1P26_24010 [Neobacillus sp. MM2021_6]|uniref:hypothetical protein n=1 Tax=Bacillaceae TaxID=186817 RepID=UPI001409DFF3|nr:MULTISPECIES: hypothetical protein [Bacillaceae]MBO0962761.1 hypothetical protein [Neobacillus sp. MM2021_6]NHC21181.1 hypothetical protein [Bacillus sp. MM2020_4]
MSLRDLLLIFSKNEYEKNLKKKLASLENDLEEMKKALSVIQEQEKGVQETTVITKEPPIIIEKINIEKIILDKYELNNNFGQLGIKELKGKLNIGATYGSEYTPNLNEEEKEKEPLQRKEKMKNDESGTSPKVKIHPKREEEMRKD